MQLAKDRAMNMQRKITGTKILYRPMMEAELSSGERQRVYAAQQRVHRMERIRSAHLHAASRDVIQSKPKKAKWFCLRVERGREFAVENLLSDANVEAFMPREKWMRVRHGKKTAVELPFFPNYMLVRIVPSEEAFHGLKRVKYVSDIVGGPNGYHVVSESHVDVFKQICDDVTVPRIATDKTISDGDRADIMTGPFAGFMCLVVSVTWSRQARARVAIDLDGKVFEIESMPLAFLKKL